MYYLASYSPHDMQRNVFGKLLNCEHDLNEMLSAQQKIVDERILKISLEGTVGCRGHGSNHSQALSTCRIQITIINRINPVVVDPDS
jgi:hypothetical protein